MEIKTSDKTTEKYGTFEGAVCRTVVASCCEVAD